MVALKHFDGETSMLRLWKKFKLAPLGDRAPDLFIHQISKVKAVGYCFGLKSQEKKWLLKMPSLFAPTCLQHGNL